MSKRPYVQVDLAALTSAIDRLQSGQHLPRNGGGPRSKTDHDEIIYLRAEGWTLNEIGKQAGVTRERVRQILASHGIRGHRPPLPEPVVFPIPGFKRAMFRWVRQITGCKHCQVCMLWKDPSDFAPLSKYMCRACNTTRMVTKYHQDSAYREHLKEYRKLPAQVARQKLASARWREKLKQDPERWQAYLEKHRLKSKEHWAATKADPVLLEKARARQRRIDAKRRNK